MKSMEIQYYLLSIIDGFFGFWCPGVASCYTLCCIWHYFPQKLHSSDITPTPPPSEIWVIWIRKCVTYTTNVVIHNHSPVESCDSMALQLSITHTRCNYFFLASLLQAYAFFAADRYPASSVYHSTGDISSLLTSLPSLLVASLLATFLFTGSSIPTR